jgi:FtsH-binding integral membrane protein
MKEYKLAKGFQVTMVIFLPLMIALGISLLLEPIRSKETHFTSASYAINLVISLPMIVVCAMAIWDVFFYKVTITDDSITARSTFGTRRLRFDEMEGFSVDKQIFIRPNRRDRKQITISENIENYNELAGWLGEHFSDLKKLAEEDDKRALENEQNEILHDDRFGFGEEERKQNLAGAARKTKTINVAGVIVAAWVLFYPEPYDFAVITSACMLTVTVLMVRASGGLIHMGSRKNSAYPSVSVAIFASALSILARAILDFDLYEYHQLWLPFAITTAVVFLLLFPEQKERKDDQSVFFDVAAAAMIFAYGAVVVYNCNFGASKPIDYNVAVISKHESRGKITSYYFAVTQWGDRSEGKKVKVSSELYYKTNPGDTIDIFLSKGSLGIPWMSVSGRQLP